eukprot:1184805-Rhodomonas_salina.1
MQRLGKQRKRARKERNSATVWCRCAGFELGFAGADGGDEGAQVVGQGRARLPGQSATHLRCESKD